MLLELPGLIDLSFYVDFKSIQDNIHRYHERNLTSKSVSNEARRISIIIRYWV